MPAATRLLAFLLVFSALFLFALGMTIVSEFTDVQWVIIVVRIGEGLGRLTLVSIATAFILVEGVPMLAAWLKKEMVKEAEERGREEGREVGREEGREEGREVGREEGREVGREEGREEGRKEGRERGLAEADRVWAAWLEEVGAWDHRKAQADREGSTFIEPRPEPPRAIK